VEPVLRDEAAGRRPPMQILTPADQAFGTPDPSHPQVGGGTLVRGERDRATANDDVVAAMRKT